MLHAEDAIVPCRHEPDSLALTQTERAEVWALVDVRRAIEARSMPGGDHVGLNVGAAAGPTVANAHLHVIPRDAGDVPDPRGGTRCSLAERAPHGARS